MSQSKIHTDTLNLAEIAIRLGSIYEREAILDTMLIDAMNMSNADGGSLYLVKDEMLHFILVKNRSLNLDFGRETAMPSSFHPIPISKEKAKNLCVFAVQKCRSVNIPDVYTNTVFDLAGTKKADEANSYRSVSMLTVPIMGASHKAIGVLQLINAKDEEGSIIHFHHKLQTVIEAIANMAAVSYTNTQLHMQNARLFDSCIHLTRAIHAKNITVKSLSLQTILSSLNTAVTESKRPPFHQTRINRNEQYNQEILIWMLELQELLGVQSTEEVIQLSAEFLPAIPLSSKMKELIRLVGTPYSVEHPLMIRMLHFATILQQVSKNQTVDATYNILEQRAQNHTLDQDLFITAQSAKIIESLLS